MVEMLKNIDLFEFTILLACVLGVAIMIEMVTLLMYKIKERKNNKREDYDNMKQVSREEFEAFITNYPRKLEKNFFMDWLDYYDFPSSDYEPKDLEDLYSYKVARYYCSPCGTLEFYIKDEENKEC